MVILFFPIVQSIIISIAALTIAYYNRRFDHKGTLIVLSVLYPFVPLFFAALNINLVNFFDSLQPFAIESEQIAFAWKYNIIFFLGYCIIYVIELLIFKKYYKDHDETFLGFICFLLLLFFSIVMNIYYFVH